MLSIPISTTLRQLSSLLQIVTGLESVMLGTPVFTRRLRSFSRPLEVAGSGSSVSGIGTSDE